MYSTYCAELAAQGYVVIAIEHEDGSAIHASNGSSKIPYKTPPSWVFNPPDSKKPGATNSSVSKFRWDFLEQRIGEIDLLWARLKMRGEGKERDYGGKDYKETFGNESMSSPNKITTLNDITDEHIEALLTSVLEKTDFSELFALTGHSFGATFIVHYLMARFRNEKNLPKNYPMASSNLNGRIGPEKIRKCVMLDFWPLALDLERSKKLMDLKESDVTVFPSQTLLLTSEHFFFFPENDKLVSSTSSDTDDKLKNNWFTLYKEMVFDQMQNKLQAYRLRGTYHQWISDVGYWGQLLGYSALGDINVAPLERSRLGTEKVIGRFLEEEESGSDTVLETTALNEFCDIFEKEETVWKRHGKEYPQD